MLGLSSLRCSAVAAGLAAGLLTLTAAAPSQAVPVSIAFDYSSGIPSTVATITGTGGLMSFSLDIGDPTLSYVFGSFSMDIVGPGAVHLGSVSLLGAPFIDGAFQDLGDAALDPSSGLTNVSVWTFLAGALDLPLSLVVTSQLDTFDAPFTPVLTVDLGGDLQVTPLPGALVLFTTGIGFLGLMGARRRRRVNAQAA